MIGYTYSQQAYKLLNIEHQTNTPAVERQWEGLVPEHLCEPEDDHDSHHRPVGVIPPPNPGPVGDIPAPVEIIHLASSDIEELADCLDQLRLNPAPAPAPPPAPRALTPELPPAPAPVAAPTQIIAGV